MNEKLMLEHRDTRLLWDVQVPSRLCPDCIKPTFSGRGRLIPNERR
ncbi:MAG TPA: hypothetical protein PKK20_02975 [Verrucomicrobiota bacterium]|nr:hypothetical protein [Verrucomicrobiota bacterium]